MFIVLRSQIPEKNLLRKYRQKKRLAECEPVSYSTENGLPFFVLDILNDKSGVSRNEIEKKCGRYVSRIVAPKTLTLPDNGHIKRFTSGTSNGLFLLNTALETIKNAHIRPDGLCITVTDRNACMTNEIHRLMPFASLVRVVTARGEKYSEICRRIFGLTGASVAVRPAYQPTEKKEIIICCDGASCEEMRDAVVFSFRQQNFGILRFFSNEVELSEKHKEIIPDDIDTVDFAAAVTELCGSTEYRHSPFLHTESNCSDCINKSPSECLECRITGKSINA